MMETHFKLIYAALLKISTHAAFFDSEKKLVRLAEQALESMDSRTMHVNLVEIGLRQGFHEEEKKIIQIAQDALKVLLYDARQLQIGMEET